jgi:cell division protein FtsW
VSAPVDARRRGFHHSGPAIGEAGTMRRAARPARPATTGLPLATRLVVLVAVLCVFGLVMVGSASPVISTNLYGSPWSILVRQVIWLVLGVAALAVTSRVDYHAWRRVRVPLLVGTLVLLVAVLLPHLGVTAGGSSRWIGFGQLRLQPSELMKLALVVFVADLLTRRAEWVWSPKAVVAPVAIVLCTSAVLVLKQPDMGTAMVLCCIAFGLLFLGGVRIRSLWRLAAGLAAGAVVLAIVDPYRRDRILSYLNPGATRSGSGYQVWQSLVGLGSGHLFGLGLGGGRQKWGLLPNAHTDFIFSVVGEELGLVGAVLLLALFLGFAWTGLRIAASAPDRFGGLLAAGVVIWIMSQAVINVGAVIGLLPVTGIPLPFISFGGSSLVIVLAASGILLNVARSDHPPGRARSSTAAAARRAPGLLRPAGARPAGARPAGPRTAGTRATPTPARATRPPARAARPPARPTSRPTRAGRRAGHPVRA